MFPLYDGVFYTAHVQYHLHTHILTHSRNCSHRGFFQENIQTNKWWDINFVVTSRWDQDHLASFKSLVDDLDRWQPKTNLLGRGCKKGLTYSWLDFKSCGLILGLASSLHAKKSKTIKTQAIGKRQLSHSTCNITIWVCPYTKKTLKVINLKPWAKIVIIPLFNLVEDDQ